MTKFLILILAFLGEAYTVFLNVVRQRSAKNPIPENLKDVYDGETYEKWRAYSKANTKLSIVTAIASAITVTLCLAFNLHSAFTALFPDDQYSAMLGVVLFAVLTSGVIDIISSYVGTMVIEEKYGFNRSSLKTFIFDKVMNLSLSFGISYLLSHAILFSHTTFGNWFILIFALIFLVFELIITFIYPLLNRIGNKFTPLEDGELRERLLALLSKYGYKVRQIEVIDASRRTTKSNAYFTGFGKLKTIVLYDNLLNTMTADEIAAIFAHEMGHGLHRDVLKSQLLFSLYAVLIGAVALLTLKIPSLYTDFGFSGINYGFMFVLIGIAISVLQPALALATNAFSRSQEYRADKQCVVEGLGCEQISALKKLARDNFVHLSPSAINVVLEYSHPPMNERILAIEAAMSNENIAKENN